MLKHPDISALPEITSVLDGLVSALFLWHWTPSRDALKNCKKYSPKHLARKKSKFTTYFAHFTFICKGLSIKDVRSQGEVDLSSADKEGSSHADFGIFGAKSLRIFDIYDLYAVAQGGRGLASANK